MAKLGVRPPTTAPRATEHIPEMVALIGRLVSAGAAYVVDGDVYFEVARFPTYGRLSGKNLDELLAGARVDVNERKRDPRDFALWKAAKPGEPSWPSPWGPGRPGWHIECSAMAMKYLGETLDLHGGGEDLIFPHHSCEIAQSEAATGQAFVRFWLHNGFVNLGSEKMSKSLGNTLTIEALLTRHDPEALRLYLLQTHYRNPVEFTEEGVAGMRRPLERFRELVDDLRPVDEAGDLVPTEPEPSPDGYVLGDGRRASRAVRGGDGRRLQHPAGHRGPESARDRRWPRSGSASGRASRSGQRLRDGRGRPDRSGPGAGAVDEGTPSPHGRRSSNPSSTPTSTPWWRSGTRPGGGGTGPRPMPCGRSSTPWAWSSKTPRRARSGS